MIINKILTESVHYESVQRMNDDDDDDDHDVLKNKTSYDKELTTILLHYIEGFVDWLEVNYD